MKKSILYILTLSSISAFAFGGSKDRIGNDRFGQGFRLIGKAYDSGFGPDQINSTVPMNKQWERGVFLKSQCVKATRTYDDNYNEGYVRGFDSKYRDLAISDSETVGFNFADAAAKNDGSLESQFAKLAVETDTGGYVFYDVADYAFAIHRMVFEELTDLGKKYVKDPKKWNEVCGSNIMDYTIDYARLFAIVRYDFETAEQKKKYFDTYSDWRAGALAKNLQSIQTTDEMFPIPGVIKITMSLYQLGGEPSAMDAVFGNASHTFTCSSKTIPDCIAFLEKMVQYSFSRDGFPAQISNNNPNRKTVAIPSGFQDSEDVRKQMLETLKTR